MKRSFCTDFCREKGSWWFRWYWWH